MPSSRRHELSLVADLTAICELCPLCESRVTPVFSRGTGRLMIVGEAPGFEENLRGRPFVGPAGELLDKMLAGMGLGAADVYITNAVKCHPPDNRTPTDDELLACNGYLAAEIEYVAPKLILALGRVAMRALGMPFPERWRGRWTTVHEIPAIATYHPAYVLRNESAKETVAKDLRQVLNAWTKLNVVDSGDAALHHRGSVRSSSRARDEDESD